MMNSDNAHVNSTDFHLLEPVRVRMHLQPLSVISIELPAVTTKTVDDYRDTDLLTVVAVTACFIMVQFVMVCYVSLCFVMAHQGLLRFY